MGSTRLRFLGLDPGLKATGWGVVDVDGNHLRHVASGVVRIADRGTLANRLQALYTELGLVVAQYRPAEAAVEETFVNVNGRSTMLLGQARGVVLLAPAEAGVPVFEYPANLVKKSIVGYGHAEKRQVALMIGHLLPGVELAAGDAADALAVAICHAHHAGMRAHAAAARA